MDQPPDIPQRPMGRIPVVARLVRGKGTLRTYGEQLRKALTCDPATMMQITSRLNVHVYPRIGDVSMGALAKRPSLIQQ